MFFSHPPNVKDPYLQIFLLEQSNNLTFSPVPVIFHQYFDIPAAPCLNYSFYSISIYSHD